MEVHPGIAKPFAQSSKNKNAKNNKTVEINSEVIPNILKGVDEKLRKDSAASLTISLNLYLDLPADLASLRILTTEVFNPKYGISIRKIFIDGSIELIKSTALRLNNLKSAA
jgi:hypothetical protein